MEIFKIFLRCVYLSMVRQLYYQIIHYLYSFVSGRGFIIQIYSRLYYSAHVYPLLATIQ